MRKSSPRTQNFLSAGSPNALRLATFRQQMADYARGQRLRELRERKHESQENVAYGLGVSVKTIRSWEHGGKIRWLNAKRLGAFYGVDAESLVSREELSAEEIGPALAGDDQLDRIEEKLDQVLELLRPGPVDGVVAELEEELPRRLAEATGSLTRPTPTRPAKQAGARRTRA